MPRNEPAHDGNQAAANFLANIQAKLGLLLKAKGVSRAELADRLKVGRPRITRLLGADSNMTVDTLARIFEALGEVPELRSEGITRALAELEARPWIEGYPEPGRVAADDWVDFQDDRDPEVAESWGIPDTAPGAGRRAGRRASGVRINLSLAA